MGNEGAVSGSYALSGDAAVIRAGDTLTVPAGAQLTNNLTITNNGTLIIENMNSISGSGTISGGRNVILDPGAARLTISLPQSTVYDGKRTTPAITRPRQDSSSAEGRASGGRAAHADGRHASPWTRASTPSCSAAAASASARLLRRYPREPARHKATRRRQPSGTAPSRPPATGPWSAASHAHRPPDEAGGSAASAQLIQAARSSRSGARRRQYAFTMRRQVRSAPCSSGGPRLHGRGPGRVVRRRGPT
ncbi:MAG: hypothetical protein ACLUEK_08460 [Oscillospiraceae bacterium]